MTNLSSLLLGNSKYNSQQSYYLQFIVMHKLHKFSAKDIFNYVRMYDSVTHDEMRLQYLKLQLWQQDLLIPAF